MKNILLISYFFAPENAIGAIRFSKFYKYLNKKGYYVKVISAEKYNKYDNILDEELVNESNVFRIMDSKIYDKIFFSLSKKSNRIAKKHSILKSASKKNFRSWLYMKARTLYSNCIRLLFDFIVYIETVKKIKNDPEILRDIDVVISSYGPLCNHRIAKWISKKKRIKWIADFRDGMKFGFFSQNNIFITNLIEKYICKKADKIVIVADGCISYNNAEKFKTKISKINNGFDRDDYKNVFYNHNKDKLSITYTGAIITKKDRDATLLFMAIYELALENKIDLNKVEFNYAGNDFNLILAQASQYGLESIIVNKGFLKREESIQLQKSSDILLHLTAYNVLHVDLLSGKFFEYLAMDKPIISIVVGRYINSGIKKIIHECKVGLCCEEKSFNNTDFILMKEFLLKVYNDKFNLEKMDFNPSKTAINRFDYFELTNKLIDVIESI